MDQTRRDIFHGMLREAGEEFKKLRDPEKLAGAFILTAMGALGTARGVVLLINRKSLDGRLISRGLPERQADRLRVNLLSVIEYHLKETLHPGGTPPLEIRAIDKKELEKDPHWPPGMELAVRWIQDDDYIGLAGLGEKLISGNYHEDELNFLFDITRSFILNLRESRHALELERMEKRLAEKNEALFDAMRQAEHRRQVSDQHLFQLKTFRELFFELRDKKSPQEIIDTFLLLIIGIFSGDKAVILLFDKKEMLARMAHRGVDREELDKISRQDIQKTLQETFRAARLEKMTPLSAIIVRDLQLFQTPLVPVTINTGIMFYIDENRLGLIGLGEKITGERLTDSEKELFLNLTHNFMVFLEKTAAFETIETLNREMEQQHQALNQSANDLGAYRSKIELLEIAKSRFRSIVQHEMRRAGRISILDFVVIVGVGIVLGILFNLANPAGIDIASHLWEKRQVESVDVHAARAFQEQNDAVVVDARPAEFFKQKHISGAVNLPLALFDFVYMMRFSSLAPDKTVIVYGRNISRLYDREVASKLALRGHQNVKLLESGLDGWERQEYPVEIEPEEAEQTETGG